MVETIRNSPLLESRLLTTGAMFQCHQRTLATLLENYLRLVSPKTSAFYHCYSFSYRPLPPTIPAGYLGAVISSWPTLPIPYSSKWVRSLLLVLLSIFHATFSPLHKQWPLLRPSSSAAQRATRAHTRGACTVRLNSLPSLHG